MIKKILIPYIALYIITLSSCVKPEPCQTCNVPWYTVTCEKPGFSSYHSSGNAAYMITYFEGYSAMGYTCQYIDSGSQLYSCDGDQIKFWKGEGYSCHE